MDRDIARQQQEEAQRRQSDEIREGWEELTGPLMSDADLIREMHLIHWRLRLRSPATVAEKRAWHGVMGQLRRRFPGQPLVDNLQVVPSSKVSDSPERPTNPYLQIVPNVMDWAGTNVMGAKGESR